MDNLENEIAEQAELLGRFDEGDITQIEKVAKIISEVNTSGGRVFLFASGSSLNACMYARELFSRDNDIALEVFPAGEAMNHADDMEQNDLALLVSQSGESRDIKKAQKLIGESIKQIVVTNNIKSKLAENADIALNLKAGEEKAMPATKTYFATLVIFMMISEALSGRIQILEARGQIAEDINLSTGRDKPKASLWGGENTGLIEILKNKKIFILGSGVMWPQAMEAELKFKEIVKTDAESYELTEFMHGPSELLDEKSVVIIFCPKLCNELDNQIISNIKKQGSKIIAIGSCDCEQADQMIKIETRKYFDLISIIVIQKIALELAKSKK